MRLELQSARKLISDEISRVIRQRCEDGGKPAKILFLHGHPRYGQVHVYLCDRTDVRDSGDIIGAPINRVIDVPDWEEAVIDEVEIILENQSTIIAKEGNSDFDIAVGHLLVDIVRADFTSTLGNLLPNRVIVMSEYGDVYEDWNREG